MALANFEPSLDGVCHVDQLFENRPKDRPVLFLGEYAATLSCCLMHGWERHQVSK